MTNLRGDWEDKQGINKKLVVEKRIDEENARNIANWWKTGEFHTPTRAQVIEILEKYNELLKEEYQDSDLWDVISQTTDKFLLKYYPKI